MTPIVTNAGLRTVCAACLADLAAPDRPPTSRTWGLARVPFGLLGRDVAECRGDALPIVVAFDVSEQVASGLVPGRPLSLVDKFDLESVEVLRQAQDEGFPSGRYREPQPVRIMEGIAFMPTSCFR